jgi:hypothetical protein
MMNECVELVRFVGWWCAEGRPAQACASLDTGRTALAHGAGAGGRRHAFC